MPEEPKVKQAVAFFDGQNFFHSAREAFGHKYPNYDPHALSRMICDRNGWDLMQVRFYTGMPDVEDDPVWNHFWTHKLTSHNKRGIDKTEWIRINRADYDSCLDPRDYRPKK